MTPKSCVDSFLNNESLNSPKPYLKPKFLIIREMEKKCLKKLKCLLYIAYRSMIGVDKLDPFRNGIPHKFNNS